MKHTEECAVWQNPESMSLYMHAKHVSSLNLLKREALFTLVSNQ